MELKRLGFYVQEIISYSVRVQTAPLYEGIAVML